MLIVTTVDITLEAFLRPFSEHLRARGWRVDGLSAGAGGNAALTGSFDALFDIGWERNPISRGTIVSAGCVREVVTSGNYDIVWVHTPVAALVTRFALRRRPRGTSRPAVIYTAHGFHFHPGGNPLANAVYRTVERAAARWTDELVTINPTDFHAARAFGVLPPERVHLVPGIGVDTTRFAAGVVSAERAAAVRREFGIPADAMMVTMAAEFTPNKRHALAIEALSRVTDVRVRLILVGDGPLLSETRRQAERLGLGDRVRFAGQRTDMDAVLVASDALLLCSAREGLNRSALEALASGVPVIGTPTRGIAEIIGADEAGWLAAGHDAASLAGAIDAAASDPAERTRRGAAGRVRAEEEYALAHVMDCYDRLFAEHVDADVT